MSLHSSGAIRYRHPNIRAERNPGYLSNIVGYRRNLLPGGTFFFTLALADRRSAALIDHVTALRSAFRVARQERPFSIDAIVVLPEHLHAVFTLPPNDSDFPGRWRRIKGCFSSELLKRGVAIERFPNGELALWQRRYWEHTIRDDADFVRHIDCIHYNPVKHGSVKRVRNWPYSSFHLHVRRGLLPEDQAGEADTVSATFGERRR